MAIRQGFAFSHDRNAQQNAPSSGDGASVASAYDPITGQRNPGYRPPQTSPRASTAGSLGGSVHSCLDGSVRVAGTNEREYREAAAASGGIHPGGSAGYSLPTDLDRFKTRGSIPADSNFQSTGVAGGPYADHEMVRRRAVPTINAIRVNPVAGRSARDRENDVYE